jgi:hypothetical protein
MSHEQTWDRWNIVFRHSGHGVHESHRPTRTYGPFSSVAEARAEMSFLATHGRIPVTYQARVEAAPLEYLGHAIQPLHAGNFVILPYNIQVVSLADARAWISHHVQTTRS